MVSPISTQQRSLATLQVAVYESAREAPKASQQKAAKQRDNQIPRTIDEAQDSGDRAPCSQTDDASDHKPNELSHVFVLTMHTLGVYGGSPRPELSRAKLGRRTYPVATLQHGATKALALQI